MAKIDVTELDIFYISYDEPNKEEHWADIISKFPFAKRVDGVKGFDNAHKECARQSDTERFISVDGDNIVDEKFFDIELSFPVVIEYKLLKPTDVLLEWELPLAPLWE